MAEDRKDGLSDEDFMSGWTAPDQFGVPFNLMGHHPEEFFSMLGRIVTLSASLENRLLVFYQSLVGAAQNEFTGVPAGKLLKRCRGELHRLDGRPDDRQLTEDFLAKAAAITERRSHYVHNLWPAQPGGRLFGGDRRASKASSRQSQSNQRSKRCTLTLPRWSNSSKYATGTGCSP